MNQLFDYGLFINSQNLSYVTPETVCNDLTPGEPFPMQWHEPSDFYHSRREVLHYEESPVINHCVYYGDLLREKTARDNRARAFHENYQREWEGKVRQFKNTIKFNLTDLRKPHRFMYPNRNLKQRLQDWGKQVAAILRDERADSEIIELLEDMRNTNADLASRVFLVLRDKDFADDIRTCDDCDAFHHCDDSQSTSNGDVICEDCCSNSYIYSDCMATYIHERDVVSVYHSLRAYVRGSNDDVCTQRYGSRNLYQYDDAFFTDADDMPREDDDDYDDEGESSSALPGYHSQSRYFTERNATPDKAALGVELEVYNDERRECVDSLHNTFADLICERDSSLDEAYGFEIVTQPYGPTEWAAFAPDLLKHLREYGTVGYQTPGSCKYGIHINVHRRHFSPLAEARIMLMLCDIKNRDFVRAIAQRKCIYNADLDVGQLDAPKVRGVSLGIGLTNNYAGPGYRQRKIYTAGKFAPINWQDNIAEFRIFNSTLNEVSFMKNLEFVWALIAWTKPQAATGNSTDHKDFIKWLASPQQRAVYPNLMNYLSRKAFFTKGGNRIENTWLSLLNKPVDTDTSELLEAA